MALIILALVVASVFVGSGAVKLFSIPASLAIRDSLDVPPAQWRMIGALEWLGAAGVLIGLAYRPLGLVAAIALGLLLLGAMITRVRAAARHQRSEAAGLALDVVTLAVAVAAAIAFATDL